MQAKNLILYDMYKIGMITKGEYDMSEFITKNKDYKIILERQPTRIWYTNLTYNYICKFTFLNNIGTKVFEFITNEEFVMNFIDAFYSIFSFGITDINTISDNFMFNFDSSIDFRMYEGYLYIYENNNLRIVIEFDDETLDEFLTLVYFTFLIDIDDGNLLSFDSYKNIDT